MPLRLFKVRNFSVGAIVSFFTGELSARPQQSSHARALPPLVPLLRITTSLLLAHPGPLSTLPCSAGMSMTGGYVYLPIFFQLVMEKSAASSGVSMIPMMLGLPVGAIITGILVTKTGSYRWFPVLGAGATIIANVLYTRMDVDTSLANQVGFLLLGGLALGPLIQVPLLAAQNAVRTRDMAVASSTVTFCQAIGGLLSVAIMQTIMNVSRRRHRPPLAASTRCPPRHHLCMHACPPSTTSSPPPPPPPHHHRHLQNRTKEAMLPVIDEIVALLPANATIPISSGADIGLVKTYFPSVWPHVLEAYATGISGTFWVGVGCASAALIAALACEHIKLRDGLAENMHMEGAPPPPLNDEAEAAIEEAGAAEAEKKKAAHHDQEQQTTNGSAAGDHHQQQQQKAPTSAPGGEVELTAVAAAPAPAVASAV